MRLLSDNQQNAIEKLRQLKVGALFMGCGTGKTQTAVTLINSVDDINLVLWVAPLRTIKNLKDEISLCEPRYNITFYGVESIGQSDRIYLEVMTLIESHKRVFMIVDESIKIKNMKAKRTKRLLTLGDKAEYKLILNGTPVTKNILDIYAQMRFLSPKILDKNFWKFQDDYCIYKTEKIGWRCVRRWVIGYTNLDHLLSLIEPYVYECSLDLSLTKQYRTKMWSLSEDERIAYENLKTELFTYLNLDNTGEMLGVFQKLQHSYCLSKEKLKILNDIVDEKTIIYCKFIRSQEALKELYPDTLILTYGKNSFGLNLQNYSKIIYFDKTFDYAHREQSEARIYRMGQQDNCEYIDLTGNVGLEKLFDDCINKKVSLVEAFKVSGLKLEQL